MKGGMKRFGLGVGAAIVGTLAVAFILIGVNCQECRRCGRFEVYGYGRYHKTPRADFPDAVASTAVGRDVR